MLTDNATILRLNGHLRLNWRNPESEYGHVETLALWVITAPYYEHSAWWIDGLDPRDGTRRSYALADLRPADSAELRNQGKIP